MDDLPKIYLTDEQHAFQMAAWRDACDATAQVNARRDAWLEQSVAMEKGILAQLAAPPSDKERLWQAIMAVMPMISYEHHDDPAIARKAADLAEAMLAEFKRRTEGGE